MLRTPNLRNHKKNNVALYRDEESKLEEDKNELDAMKEKIKCSTKDIKKKDERIQENQKYADLLTDFFQKGIIDSKGKFIHDKLDS